MDVERACIAKILIEDQLVAALDARLTTDFFAKPDNKKAFQWILAYWGKYGTPPTADAFKLDFPTLRLPKSSEPIAFLVDQLRENRRHMLLSDALLDVSEMMHDEDGRTPEMLARLSTLLIESSAETSVADDVDLIKTWDTRLAGYKALRHGGGTQGITIGIETVDASFGGLRAEQLVTLIGEPKSGKSMLLLAMAHAAHLEGNGVLYVGFEMSNQEQGARHDALAAGLDHNDITRGNLNLLQVAKLNAVGRKRQKMQPFILSSDIGAATTVSGLRAKIELYHPAVLYVDGVYLMDDELGADRFVEQSTHLTNITRTLKRLAQTTKIPIVCTTQVLTWKLSKKRGLTADSIGYSSSFAQDSDIIIGVEQVEDDTQLRKIKVILSRMSAPMETRIMWDWTKSNFTETGVIVGNDAGYEREERGGRAEGSF